ncbi:TetR/AcrR family transcriptional regulator [Roseibium denhamense]|uniref:Transcriptional regulator, TetR family n=1 Tax=Roseibium denhamense TaxID=76305 RepID=A0ABY1N5Q3_9HYPH|nr:TetR/AcrR family transcriptional regulator [Roseibium denhamense]MTI04365.1 TetR/AcrR family transcriptional regulator [Roseibium denhamense]SMP00900.1 transcriptional regulator, TetR family [Roseibium denhamense]
MKPGASPRKQQTRTAITRARLLHAAGVLANGKRLDDLTAEAIAKEAGVAKGTLFAHFGDMDGLFSHLLLGQLQQFRMAAEEETLPSPANLADPVGALTDQVMALLTIITESRTMLRLFMENIGVTKGHCAPEFAEQLDALGIKIAAFLKAWQASQTVIPQLRQDRSPEEMLEGVYAFLIHGAVLYSSYQIDDRDLIRARLYRHIEALLIPVAPK